MEVSGTNPRHIAAWVLVAGIAVAIVFGLVQYLRVWRYIEKTDNAYVEADVIVIAPKIAGYVVNVAVADNQPVKPGQLLIRIDPASYRAAHDMAVAQVAERQADLERFTADVERQTAAAAEARANVGVAEAAAKVAMVDAGRFERLAKTGADTVQHKDLALSERDMTKGKLLAARAAAQSADLETQLLKTQVGQGRAALQAAMAKVRATQTELDGAEISSPIAGIIGDRTARVGQFVQPGTRLMTVVPNSEVYIVANFKETQLRYMRVGQPVEVEIDAIPGPAIHGVIESLAPGTGAQFALLPPENATGNFTRIVQRVPVRIALKLNAEQRDLLRPGLSADVKVDTRSTPRQ